MNEFGKQLEGKQQKLNGSNIRTDYTDKMIFERFTNEYSEYCEFGITSSLISHDEKFLLECKKKRLEALEIDGIESISAMPFSEVSGITFTKGKYNLKHLKRSFRRHLMLKSKTGKSIERKQDIILEADILYNIPNSIEDKEKLCCPYCGEIEELKKLESGCESCGKESFITNHFPKIQRFFYRKNMSLSILSIGKILFWCSIIGLIIGIPIGVAGFIDDVSIRFTKNTISDAIVGIFKAPLDGILIGVVIAVFVIFFRIIHDNFKLSSFNDKTQNAKNKISKVLTEHEEKFSYESFEGKLIYLLKLIIYSDNPEKLPICNFEKPIRNFGIVDSVYKGFTDLKSIHIEDDICKITIDIHMSDIYYDSKRFFEKEDVFTVSLQKKVSKSYDIGFEIKNVTCPLCKEHFDAFKEHECTFCGKEYDLKYFDWTVTAISLK